MYLLLVKQTAKIFLKKFGLCCLMTPSLSKDIRTIGVLYDPSSSIKVSIAAPEFATSTLMTACLKVVTIECIEHDVTCLNERVFIKTDGGFFSCLGDRGHDL